MEDDQIPLANFNLTDIHEIIKMKFDETISILAVIKSVDDLKVIKTKYNNETAMRTINLLDTTSYTRNCSLWGEIVCVYIYLSGYN